MSVYECVYPKFSLQYIHIEIPHAMYTVNQHPQYIGNHRTLNRDFNTETP